MKGDFFLEFFQNNFYFRKNISGVKKNIVVKKVLNDKRFTVLFGVMKGLNKAPLKIVICNSETKERFMVFVSDVSYFEGYYIISWRERC